MTPKQLLRSSLCLAHLPVDLITEFGSYPIRLAQAIAAGVALGWKYTRPSDGETLIIRPWHTDHPARRAS
ncbi:hypothetical protein [Mycobacterium botniense]|uniref:Uncharacterized protein n=1 Tax=Mycobacterium botniense TaxID=84962 RepID=A0A7I9XY63_9MYCO|nr:hypothetical protein [Mycobacterium botniense]GFG74749.1 hypothetical protein MBOT_21140 [Mycobacterium botniense]